MDRPRQQYALLPKLCFALIPLTGIVGWHILRPVPADEVTGKWWVREIASRGDQSEQLWPSRTATWRALDLRPDGTFDFAEHFSSEGRWKLDGDRVHLTFAGIGNVSHAQFSQEWPRRREALLKQKWSEIQATPGIVIDPRHKGMTYPQWRRDVERDFPSLLKNPYREGGWAFRFQRYAITGKGLVPQLRQMDEWAPQRKLLRER